MLVSSIAFGMAHSATDNVSLSSFAILTAFGALMCVPFLLTGNLGRPGCGSHSQTGQPNAMSERLMGGLTGRLPFNKPLSNTEWRNHIADAWGVPRERRAISTAPAWATGISRILPERSTIWARSSTL